MEGSRTRCGDRVEIPVRAAVCRAACPRRSGDLGARRPGAHADGHGERASGRCGDAGPGGHDAAAGDRGAGADGGRRHGARRDRGGGPPRARGRPPSRVGGGPLEVVHRQGDLEQRIGHGLAVLPVHQLGQLHGSSGDDALPGPQQVLAAVPALRRPPFGGPLRAGHDLVDGRGIVHREGPHHLAGGGIERLEGLPRAGRRVEGVGHTLHSTRTGLRMRHCCPIDEGAPWDRLDGLPW